MTLRIEIHEQPERQRFWAEVEVGGMIARRREVTSPREDGLSGILAVVHAAAFEMDPRLAPKLAQDEPQSPAILLGSVPTGTLGADVLSGKVPLQAPDDLDALRAEAEAAGVDVDRRWGEARLRREITSAGAGSAPE